MKPLEAFQRAVRGEPVTGFTMRLPPAVMGLVGFEFAAVERGSATFRIRTDLEKHANPMGTVHGGILCDVADAAMGVACASLLDEGESFTTLELRMTFLRPVWEATLEARAKVVHQGRTLAYVECDVVNTSGEKLVARASSTCLILRGDEATGR